MAQVTAGTPAGLSDKNRHHRSHTAMGTHTITHIHVQGVTRCVSPWTTLEVQLQKLLCWCRNSTAVLVFVVKLNRMMTVVSLSLCWPPPCRDQPAPGGEPRPFYPHSCSFLLMEVGVRGPSVAASVSVCVGVCVSGCV